MYCLHSYMRMHRFDSKSKNYTCNIVSTHFQADPTLLRMSEDSRWIKMKAALQKNTKLRCLHEGMRVMGLISLIRLSSIFLIPDNLNEI